MSRIASRFAELASRERIGIITFLTVGYPSLAASQELASAVVAGGADLIELGIPFSDPLADGATIQRASFHSLRNGVTIKDCLDVAGQIRGRLAQVPLILMGYYNPIYSYGIGAFVDRCAVVGVDGLIVADLPADESQELGEACLSRGLDLIFMVAPTSTEERIAMIGRKATGFIYCVSVTGVTGARSDLGDDLPRFVRRVRRYSGLPLAIGFGISSSAHVKAISAFAQGAVIGSALIDIIDGTSPEQQSSRVEEFIKDLRES